MAAFEFEDYTHVIPDMNAQINTLLDEILCAYRTYATAHLAGVSLVDVSNILNGADTPERDRVNKIYESEIHTVPVSALEGLGSSIMTICNSYSMVVVIGALGRLMATHLLESGHLVYEDRPTVNPFTALFGQFYSDEFSTNTKGEVVGFNFSDDGTFVIDLSQFGATVDDGDRTYDDEINVDDSVDYDEDKPF